MSGKGCIQAMMDSIMLGVSRALLPKRRKWVISDMPRSPVIYPQTQSRYLRKERDPGCGEGRQDEGGVCKDNHESKKEEGRTGAVDFIVTRHDEIEYSPVIWLKK